MARSCLLICLVCLAGTAAADVPTPTAAGLLDVGGSKIYYETSGEGPVLVLIHDGLVAEAFQRSWLDRIVLELLSPVRP